MNPEIIALVATFAPLIAFLPAITLYRSRPAMAATLVIGACALTTLCTWVLLLGGAQPEPIVRSWLVSGDMDLTFGFLLDGTSLLMGCIVSTVALCVMIYSVGYMEKDGSKGRFFALLGLFTWSMLSFVYAASLLQAFIFWELVGLCSFLLIGFWYRKPDAIAAAKKAFIMTRIGDVGLMIGLIVLLKDAGTLDIAAINTPEAIAGLDNLDLICGLMFMGIIGKSAQFPLHTWLPDAMAGPTPVSALLHSATMVAAGVFLFARFHPLFMASPTVLAWVVGIATFTAVLASTMAMVAYDIKKVLAYSSISQLGFMLMGLAAGSLYAGVFHLTTHAAFKALLFLCAGAYIHHVGVNDMVAIGRGGARRLKVTSLCFIVGAFALAGLPPLAGFFSKEAIIAQLGETQGGIIVGGAYLAAFMTAYYTFRMVFLILRPDANSKAEIHPSGIVTSDHAHSAHEPPWNMRGPLVVLAAFAVVLGFMGGNVAGLLGVDAIELHLSGAAPAVMTALAGVALAWFEFGRPGSEQVGFLDKMPAVADVLRNRWYIDSAYRNVVTGGAIRTAKAAYRMETKGLDAAGDSVGNATLDVGEVTAESQGGRVQVYLATVITFAALMILFLSLGLSN